MYWYYYDVFLKFFFCNYFFGLKEWFNRKISYQKLEPFSVLGSGSGSGSNSIIFKVLVPVSFFKLKGKIKGSVTGYYRF